jgi:chromosome segregation ATPase
MLRTPFSFFLLTAAALAQTQGAAPPDALQALLAEVHQLRLDLQATTVTAQRVQILLYRVQLQQATTARAAARADEAHAKLADAQKHHARDAADLQQMQDWTNTATDPEKAKVFRAQAADLKRQVESWSADEQQWQAKDAEAQSQLRAEQARLDELQDTLDRLDKALASVAKQ